MKTASHVMRACTLVAFAIAGVSCATVPSFDELDLDRNDALSREELSARPRVIFDRFDYDHDGWVSRAEYENPVPIGAYSGGHGGGGSDGM
jgi:hypothetical protein